MMGDLVNLNYERRGSGPPLLLIHGAGGSVETWEPVMDFLAAQHTVFALDLPGFGSSPALSAGCPPTVPILAEVVAEWLDEEGLGCPHVAGNSLGGGVALELARLGRVSSVTAFSPVGFWGRLGFAYGAFSLRMTYRGAKLIGPIAPLVLGNRVGRTLALSQVSGRPWRLSGDAAVRSSRAMVNAPALFDQIEATGDYRVEKFDPIPEIPITIAWGKRDRLLFRRQFRRAQGVLPCATFILLPGCGHVPMADDATLVTDVILRTNVEAGLRAVRF
jgi:pimeloyl-ACP methyl ester carboxylesterase